jgi:photosystem II stability/assembly factor-like uncharacterized protein/S-formylglutathione hydrolase FrmB
MAGNTWQSLRAARFLCMRFVHKRVLPFVCLCLCVFVFHNLASTQTVALRFEITTTQRPASGRLLVVISKSANPEPRNRIGETGPEAPPILGRDVQNFGPGVVAVIDKTAAAFPIASLDALPAGDYYVQALLDSNIDLKSVNAPGNPYSDVQRVRLDPRSAGVVKLNLTRVVPAEELPPNDQYIRYIKIQSDQLTKFHGRPMYLRAGVILPKDYESETQRRYPVRVHIGGYGSRYTNVRQLMGTNSEFRRVWLAADTPRMIFLHLDGDGPYGDPYQVNSANHGPYGDAITKELIPHIERSFRAIAEPHARVLDGASTGGWVSLALKIFYPDFFNAVWSSCPDGVDFRGLQLIDIYKDRNAYVDDRGVERPSKRDITGRVEFTVRHESQMENVMGAGDSWTMSGQQWGAWNATYGPRGADGRPVPLWDPKTGVINRSVVEHWKKYDLRLVLEQNWKTLNASLRGKLHIAVGEADDYYLNNAVHMLDEFFKRANPPAEARIAYGSREGHCWSNITEAQMMREMSVAVQQGARGTRGQAALWEEQKSGTTARLRGISAVDLNVVWASGNSGTFVKTIDGGETWVNGVVAGGSDLDFRDVHGVDANTAYLLATGEGEKSRIYKTTDGGRSWNIQFTNRDPKAFYDGFAFWNATNGIAFSDPVDGRFLVIRTADGGATWSEIPRQNMPLAVAGEAGFAASGTSIVVQGQDLAWIATGGAAARVFRSTDRGLTWSASGTPMISGSPSSGIFSISSSGLAVGGDYQKETEPGANFAISADQGQTWKLGPPLPGYRSAVAVASSRDEAVWVAVGPSGTDYLRPAGSAWIRIGTVGYDTVSFLPGLATGWAAGQAGRIARWRQRLP